MLGRIAEAEKFDLKSVTLRPLQQVPNMLAAVRSGQVDATIAIASQAKPLAASGEVKIIAWVGDVAPYQITALFTTERMIATRADALHRFARAYLKGVADYREAFLRRDAAGKPVSDAKTDAVIAAIGKYVFKGDPDAARKIVDGVGYYDPNAALDVVDVTAQLKWFEAQGMVKGDIDPHTIIDTRFMPVLPAG
jgi:NitT/TauT family transport system substrate-binding protein